MNGQKLIQNFDDFPDTHYFVYESRRFPIKIDFFRISSKKFANSQINVDSNKNINLLDTDSNAIFQLTDESIQSFIKYVQHQETFLNNNNVSSVHLLAKKYEVDSLIRITENYINENHKEIALPFLLIYQSDLSIDTSHYETIIGDNLNEYIEDDRLTKLKIPILYRIINRYSNGGTIKNEFENHLIEFLFKCLDEHKTSASVLFSFVNIEKARSELLSRLLNDYNKIFDFHYLHNQSLVKTLYEIQSEMISKEKQNEMQNIEMMAKFSREFEGMKKEVKKECELNTQLAKNIHQQNQKYEGKIKILETEIRRLNEDKQKSEIEMKKLNNEITSLKSCLDNLKILETEICQLNEDKQKSEIEMKKLNNEITSLKRYLDNLIKEYQKREIDFKKLQDEMVQLKANTEKQLKEQKEIMKIHKILCEKIDVPFTGDQFNGLIRKLGNGKPINVISEKIIKVMASSVYNHQRECLPMHVVEYNQDSYFYSSNTQNSWIMFDFKDKKVNISHYSIQTNNFGYSGYYHLQNWCIEGSNTKSNWKSLDTHTNDKSLDYRYASRTFPITNMSSNDFYRYIRLRQTDVNTNGSHEILLSSIEFFGSIIA